MAEFTEEFNVQVGRKTYRKFIQKLRELLHDPSRAGRPQGRPVLPLQRNPPNRWFDIVLRTNSVAIRLRIRRDNLYLDGFRAEDSDQWFEFGFRGSSHLIHDQSIFMGFDGNYINLERVGGPRDKIKLSQRELVHAVEVLAKSTNTQQDRAKSLIVVLQMICESIRFQSICNHLADKFFNGTQADPVMQILENGWSFLSAQLLCADDNARYIFRPLQPAITGIRTREEAGATIGIILQSDLGRRGLGNRRSPDTLNDEEYCNDGGCSPDALNDGECPVGQPLVEVFYVSVDGEKPGDLYGTITVIDALGSEIIYNRTRDDYESIYPGQNALLTGPARAIFAYDSFTIDVDLKDKDAGLDPDDEVSRRQIGWNVYNTTNSYDELISCKIDGQFGSVTINYAVLGDAKEAKVEVTLIHGDGESLYGRIVALNGINESVLFRREKNERIDVRPGQLIPLSRSIVAVPLDYSLKVRAELYDDDAIIPEVDEIANGTVEFPARLSPPSESEKTISGKYGKIGVKVSFT